MDAPAKHKNPATMPCRKIAVKSRVTHILHYPDGQRIIIYSWDGTFRVWDLERNMQVGEEWEDKDEGVEALGLSPSGKTVVTGSKDGAVKLWNVDTGKVMKEWTGHTEEVKSMCWSPDGRGRVLSGSWDETFKVWDVESGETDGKMIATGGDMLEIWDANTGRLLKTFEGRFMCLTWTLDGKTLIAGGFNIRKFDTATWTEITVPPGENIADTILLSPNERILASTSFADNIAQLWSLETNKPIGTPLHHEDNVISATFSTDGKFLLTGCRDDHLYTWDISAIVKEAGLPSDIADAIPQPPPKIKGARQIPPGFFNDAQREANFHTPPSQSHTHPTPAPHQRTFSSFWRRSKPHGATESDTRSRSQPLSWTRNLVSGLLRRRDGSDIQLREVDVPYTAGKPRNYHARKKKPATNSSRPSNTHTTQQPNAATQSTPPSSQQPPPTATTSTLPVVAGTPTTGTISSPHVTVAGWCARFVGLLCCVPIRNTSGQP